MNQKELRRIGRLLCRDSGLQYRSLSELPNRLQHWGDCDKDGNIRVRLKWYKRERSVSRRTVIEVLCHEMAHLVCFDHSNRFNQVERMLKGFARKRFRF